MFNDWDHRGMTAPPASFDTAASDLQDALAATDARAAGAHGFENRAGVQPLDECVELVARARQFDCVGFFGHVDDAAAEDIRHPLHFFAFLAYRSYLDQHELPLDVGTVGQVHHFHHLDQAVQMLRDLFDHVVGADGDDGQTRQRMIFGRRHRQGFDVVAACREQADHARQRARFVFQQHGNDVSHVRLFPIGLD
ncbi:hypothetical protein BGL_1c27880 [Burkholderia plantarii]|uniref:Uncharacterized protein n=1 Tax=Burkholderia plantarii TaxID=41899 RepID=A0A0B6S4V7_BURPL|nr:hypothetical protein BGL_1c27880 [Burkholderia plantarii]